MVPSSFIRWKAGLSFSISRIQTEMPSSTIETRNGMRQPQAAKSSGDIETRQPRMTRSDRKRPSVAVVWIHEV